MAAEDGALLGLRRPSSASTRRSRQSPDHKKESISVAAYRWSALLPGLLLGVLPFLGALVSSSVWLAAWGIFFTLAASGDLLVVWLVRDVSSDALVIDHSSRCGCEVVT
ncbi:MAG: metalloprotease family protein [Gemmatimonadota bacterium]|nr:metalloprotease family protein [Gemmatimonadota bacterium]